VEFRKGQFKQLKSGASVYYGSMEVTGVGKAVSHGAQEVREVSQLWLATTRVHAEVAVHINGLVMGWETWGAFREINDDAP
jgi:hypothetical protein